MLIAIFLLTVAAIIVVYAIAVLLDASLASTGGEEQGARDG